MTDNDDNALTGMQTRHGLPAPAASAPSPATANGEEGNAPANPAEHPVEHPKAATAEDVDLGNALRAIYRQTVEESIPDEMLELLKHLD